ncbi:unnamed protein product [Porites evermanni]|uniref:Iminophenyl-pyruvate dimer synthase domain-containing protein n=1 Tax=Porites evermanni TaxID=104178 RepID=A0ABN8Q5J9_9CNID|nr:unnamed protein product [Porites evermanni]
MVNFVSLYPQASGNFPDLKCNNILLAENRDGMDIHPYSTWTFRKNPGEAAKVQLLATKFGEPLSGARVRLDPCNCEKIFSGGPKVGQPALDVPSNLGTDKNGLVTFDIETKDPKNNRSYIDGQLYPFMFSLESQNKSCSIMCENDTLQSTLRNLLVVIHVWDQYKPKGEEPTWLDDVYPIFKQYANLYPVMTDNFVNLGNYYDVINHKNAILMSLQLPISHPNHMPVSRDLSKSKRQVIIKWLSKDKLPFGEPKKFYSVEHLRRDLQTALELEHATIPTYLTALASIKSSYNLKIQRVMKVVIIQEMMHMALVANILNAVGGEPSLYSKNFIPNYPCRLPGGVQPDLIIPIEKLSLGLIRNIFMKIEEPHEKTEDCTIQDSQEDEPDDRPSGCPFAFSREQFLKESTQYPTLIIFSFLLSKCNSVLCKTSGSLYFPGEDIQIVKHQNTIGAFYNHIFDALSNLTDCGKNNSIFTGNRSRQVTLSGWSVHGHTIEVHNYLTAVDAIKEIIEQGEGSSPCNPVAWDTGSKKDLSHYFMFYSVAEEHEINVVETNASLDGSEDDGVTDFIKLCNGTYYFNGSKISFDPEGVWPMVPNPRMSKYKKGSNAYWQAERLNKVYTKLLQSLDNVFNGHPETLKDALGLMFSVDLHLRNLLATPIDDNGDPDVGPNAGPTFDFTP